jgi:uncharacterized protein
VYRESGALVVSASDLVGFAACAHLTWLDLQVTNGSIPKPFRKAIAPKTGEEKDEAIVDTLLDLLIQRGREHEQNYKEALERQGISVLSLDDEVAEDPAPHKDLARLRQLATETAEGLDAFRQVIYQGTFLDESQPVFWRGHADFIKPVEDEDGANFEPEDTKLAGHVSVNAVIQLCNYVDHIERVTGKRPKRIRVVLGRGSLPEEFLVKRLFDYYSFLKRRFLSALEEPVETYPLPVEHCGVCRWRYKCEKRWEEDDHLSQVAFITRAQVKRLEAAGLTKMAMLARADKSKRLPGISPEVLIRLVEQADLQKRSKDQPVPEWKLVLPAEKGLGLAPLPEPSRGDVFYDIEGHPYIGNHGLEYLHGIGTIDTKEFRFRGEWAHNPSSERRVFEEFVDFVMERWSKHPRMHVYHYAAYETTALTRLMGQYGTREKEIDAMLRGNIFVDLYRVVRQGVRIGVPSYSIKKLEPLYMGPREGEIVMATSSVIQYERWLQTGDKNILGEIELYNMEDVKSTYLLREWLEKRRAEVVEQQGDLPRTPTLERESAGRDDPALRQLIDQLNADRPTPASNQ